MSKQTYTHFFTSGLTAVDVVTPGGRGGYCGKSFDDLKKEYPDLQVEEVDAFIQRKEAALITEPAEIDLEKFSYYLDVLPPDNFHTGNGVTYFQMCEHQSGRITQTCVALNVGEHRRYFAFDDVAGLPVAQAVAKVKAWLDKTEKKGNQ